MRITLCCGSLKKSVLFFLFLVFPTTNSFILRSHEQRLQEILRLPSIPSKVPQPSLHLYGLFDPKAASADPLIQEEPASQASAQTIAHLRIKKEPGCGTSVPASGHLFSYTNFCFAARTSLSGFYLASFFRADFSRAGVPMS